MNQSLALAARLGAKLALDSAPRNDLLPGTVQSVLTNGTAYVLLDGQTVAIPAQVGSAEVRGNQRVMVQFIPPSGALIQATVGTGRTTGLAKPYATVLVAASDSIAAGAADADFVCTGSADDVTIQAAIDSISGVAGGRVLLLEGDYSVGISGIVVNDAIWLQGQGPGTRIVLAATASSGWLVQINNSSQNIKISDMTFVATAATAGAQIGIDANGTASESRVEDCLFFMDTRAGCYGIELDDERQLVTGCTFNGGAAGINVTAGSFGGLIFGNVFASLTAGVVLTATEQTRIALNMFEESMTTGVSLVGDCDRNFVVDNYFSAAFGGNGIEILAATAADNVIVGNHMLDSTFGGVAISDAGTTTRLVYPNHVTWGDNFVV